MICGDAKHQVVLIALHICSFLMSYDSGSTSIGDYRKTIVKLLFHTII